MYNDSILLIIEAKMKSILFIIVIGGMSKWFIVFNCLSILGSKMSSFNVCYCLHFK